MKDKLIWYILTRICRYLVKQGYHHESNIARYYSTMLHAARKEFYEDNDITIRSFLTDCFLTHKLPYE